MMQTIAGGAAARPFITHHNALDMDLFLRIAPELFLKRLLVGGMEKVFEINRNFRNEGLSTRHNPEFTMLELYQAYADYNIMMNITEELISSLVEKYCDSPTVTFGENDHQFQTPMAAQPRRAAGGVCRLQYRRIAAVRAKACQLGLNESTMDDVVVVNEVFEATVEERLIDPTFVINYPAALCPLTKRSKSDLATPNASS